MMVKRVHRWADPTEYATDREYVAATHLFKMTYKDRTGRKRSSIIRDYELIERREKKFKKIVKGYGLRHRREKTPYGSNVHVWENPRVKLVTEHDPLSRKVPKGFGFEPNTGFAGYMGLTGKPATVRRLAGTIRKRASYIKEEEEGVRSFI